MKATLVKIDVASADLGKTVAEIFDLVDGGSLLEPGLVWVFDVSASRKKNRRDLRFWRMELTARAENKTESLRSFELETVIDHILPEGCASLTAGELDLLWQLRPRTRLDLNRQLVRRRRLYAKKSYPRWVLTAFLKRRWLGACYHRPHWQKTPTIPSRPRASSPCGSSTLNSATINLDARSFKVQGREPEIKSPSPPPRIDANFEI